MLINPKLKTAFRFNALFSAICAALLLSTANWWANQFGLTEVFWVQAGAVTLILFAAYLFWVSSTQEQPKVSISGIIFSDWAYVFGALTAIAFAWSGISIIGMSFLLITSLIVAIAAEWQRRAAFVK